MKISNKFKAISKTLVAAVTISAVLVSCSKDKVDYTPQPISAMDVIHASPTTEKLDFYIGESKVNTDDFAYTNRIEYKQIYSGEREMKITKKGSSTSVLTEKLKLANQMAYSLFIIDSFDKVKFLLVKDSVTMPGAGKAKLRFINLSPDAPALSLSIVGKDVPVATNKLFKEYSNFESVDAGDKVTFKIKDGTGADIATLVDQKIENGKVYTVWAKGLKTATTEEMKVGAAIFAH
nr:DUF4397 domain-containing protein [Pedobacter panaciterrae]